MTALERTTRVPVVIANSAVRQLIGWVLNEMNLPHVLASTWRSWVAEVTGRPSLSICDIDDVKGTTMGMVALVSRGGDPVPLIALSRRPDVEQIAGAFGAVEGLRKPINVALLTAVIDRTIA